MSTPKRHLYVGWKKVKGWKCLRCGLCCSQFLVQLTPWEALYYRLKYGPVVFFYKRSFYLGFDEEGRCIFLRRRNDVAYCMIYRDRPRVCRMYPFYVRESPLEGRGIPEEDAEVTYKGQKLYVYVDRLCPGVDEADNIDELLPKVLKVWEVYFKRSS